MKFVKNFGEYHTVNEARKTVNKEEINNKVLEFLNKKKGIATQAQIAKETGLKVEVVYGSLIDLADDDKVEHINVYHYDEIPKRKYPYYYSKDALDSKEAEEVAQHLEDKSRTDNEKVILKKKEAAKKSQDEKKAKAEAEAGKRKDYKTRKDKGEVKPRGRKKATK